MEMKLGRAPRRAVSTLASRLCRVIPSAEENTWWLESTAMMSFQRLIDQNGPWVGESTWCTGSSARNRSKIGHMASWANSSGSAGSTASMGRA